MLNNYIIVTDATADLPQSLVEELSLEVIPMECSLDDQTFEIEPTNRSLDPKIYYERMREGAATSTSQINVFTYNSFFTPLLEKGFDILYIAFSSGLTGSQQSAAISIEELKAKFPARRIIMIDSLDASMGEGLLVYAAAQQRAAGLDLDALAQWVTDNRLRISHWVAVDDLKYLERGGRLSSTAAFFGQALRIKPIIHMDDHGHLIAIHKVQGRRHSLKYLVERMKATYTPAICPAVFLAHADSVEDAQYVCDLVKAEFGVDVLVNDMSPIIGAHAGPGTIALFHFGARS